MTMIKAVKKLFVVGVLSSVMAAPLAWADNIVLGFSGPLSGGAALYGQDAVDGLNMAAKEINDSGGVTVAGKKYGIKIVALDDKYAPSQAAVNARRLVQRDKAKIVFSPHSGGIYALQAFNERSDFILMAYSSVPNITERGNKLTIRMPPTYTGYIKPFVELTMERYGKKLAIANATHDYAKLWTEAFIPAWEAHGGEVVANNPMDYNKSADFYTGVSRSLAEKPDVLFIGGASEPTGLVASQARQLGFKGAFVLMDQAKMFDVAAVSGGIETLEGSVGVVPLDYYENKGAQLLVEKYKKIKNSVPSSEVALHYFSVYLVVEAMKQAGSVDDTAKIRAAFAQALETLPPEYNTYDMEDIDENGGLLSDPHIAVVRDGEVILRRVSEFN